MKPIVQIKLFLSSPSDVSSEREIVENVIKQINNNEGLKQSYNVYTYRWENQYVPDWGTYQERINKELEDTDIYVGILWNRFGTPTNEYSSGTEEEFEVTRKLVKGGKKIELCFYKCKVPAYLEGEELKQKEKVDAFFKNYVNKVFGACEYTDKNYFETKFRNDILTKIELILNRTEDLKETYIRFDKHGITKFYTSEFNSIRNKDKEEFLKTEEGDICLLAHTGNAYLRTSQDGGTRTFFDCVKQRLLSKPHKMRILLLNPYSLEARKISYAENFSPYRNDISSINADELEKGINYQRFEKCIQGINDLKKELGKYGNRLEARITNLATDGTILMSNNRLFYEPYVASRFLSRIEKGLNLFEIQVKNLLNRLCPSVYNHQICIKCKDKFNCSDNLYKILAEQFYILWETSVSLTEFREQRKKYKEDFTRTQHDLFYKQIVQLHDSWFAFDPVIGCNGNCVYCFLGPQGWKNTTPHLRNSPTENVFKYLDKAYYKQLLGYQYVNSNDYNREQLGDIPVSIGNKTDMMFKSNRKYLEYTLDLHNKKNTKRPIVIITKQKIDLNIIDTVKNYGFDVIFLYSIAFLPEDFEPNVPSYKARLESAKKVREKINKENIKNVRLIHYWRPITGFVEECFENIFIQAKQIFDCSICLGLKINGEIYNSIKANHPDLSESVLSKKDADDIKNGTEIMEPAFEELQKVARKHSYPVFQHTSCALSYVQEKADFNGSMWRENFCNNCIQAQKKRCISFKMNWNKDNCISLLNENAGTNNYSFKEDCIKIDSTISQERINFLTHSIGKPVFSDSIQLTLVWPSSNQIYYRKKYSQRDEFEVVKTEYSVLAEQLERLKGITGFISIIGDDNRINAFNRYDHVCRVVRLLKWYINDLKDLDLRKCAFLGLFHDINRLPFAHNIENAINFSQAETLRKYMNLFDTVIDETYYDDFNSFFNRELNGSKESRIVYIIDSVQGFIEDALFALTALNAPIPEDVISLLGFDEKVILAQDIARLKKVFNKREINIFNVEFGDIAFEYSKKFIKKYNKNKIFDDNEFINIRNKIKNEFLIKQIFPINNETVSKGQKLSSEIGIPYIEYIRKTNQDIYSILFKQTDRDLLKDAVSKKIITNEREYYPDFDF